jgi:hypothetical protein
MYFIKILPFIPALMAYNNTDYAPPLDRPGFILYWRGVKKLLINSPIKCLSIS